MGSSFYRGWLSCVIRPICCFVLPYDISFIMYNIAPKVLKYSIFGDLFLEKVNLCIDFFQMVLYYI